MRLADLLSRPRPRTRPLWTLAVGFTLAAYIVTFAAGTAPTHVEQRYQQLADGFLHGHLYLPEAPKPALLRLPDPYDPGANRGLRAHDMSLYHGRYYMYFGPTSALLAAVVTLLGGGRMPDSAIAWVWGFALALTLAAFFDFFNEPKRVAALTGLAVTKPFPMPMLALGYIASAVNIGCLICLYRPLFYEASILGASFFFWTAATLSMHGLITLEASPRRSNAMLLSSGVCFALSFFSRYSYAPAIAVAAALIAGLIFRRFLQRRMAFAQAFLTLSCVGMPLLLMSLAFFWYNAARFGSLWETGYTYELPHIPQHLIALKEGLFGLRYVKTNLWMYFLHPMHYGFGHRPVDYEFVSFPAWTHTPVYYTTFGTAGLFWYHGGLYASLLLAGLWLAARRKIPALSAPCSSALRISAVLMLIFIAQMLPLLFLFAAAMRYSTDFLIPLTASLTFFCTAANLALNSRLARIFTYAAFAATILIAILATFCWHGYF